MALCTFSNEFGDSAYTIVDNTFISEFLPEANGEAVKVYLFGLSLCSKISDEDNSLESMMIALSMTKDEVESAFLYWQDMGLVQIVSKNPFEVKFLLPRSHSGSVKIRNKEKYSDFNKQLQDIISDRMIGTNEYNDYYNLMETHHFDPNALLLIAKYCVSMHGKSIGKSYILAVARSFVKEGLKSYESVEQKFVEHEMKKAEIRQIMTALGLKRDADIDERNLYFKWSEKFGFTQGVIVEVAQSLKKRGGFAKLDELLSKYYEQKLMTSEQISAYSAERDNMFETARVVVKNLGLYYQTFENVVDTYIIDWFNKGFDRETLQYVSQYCFKQSIRTLEGMGVIVQKFFKLGIVSMNSIEQYMMEIVKTDEDIKLVIGALGLCRNVSNTDRELYRNWTENWGLSNPQIVEVAKAVSARSSSMQFLGRTLSDLHALGNITQSRFNNFVSKLAKNSGANKAQSNFEMRDYSREQLSAVFDSLDDVEI